MYWHDALPTLFDPLTAKSRIGLITDMDGTISPIVDKPDQACVTPRGRELLRALQTHLALVAVVSGRTADDVRRRVDLPGLVYVGNHGLERLDNGEVVLVSEAAHYRQALETAYDILHARLLPGMTIEDKVATLSVHYRQTDDPQSVAARFRPMVETIAQEQELRVFEGRMIFELRPPVDINKGSAFQNLVSQHHLDAAIYIGDDTTDVDALRMARTLREAETCFSVGIGVQSPDMPVAVNDAADVMAAGISDVEDFLSWLLQTCSASST